MAVILVCLYHFGLGNVSGGYIGVDVFYVLSGFFITTQLWKMIDSTDRVSFREFYTKRARRLLPTASLVLIVTAVATLCLLPHMLFTTVGWDTIYAALNAVNYRFAAAATDYLQADQTPSPVLHYWSLSVEEQFYALWPLALAIASGAIFRRWMPALRPNLKAAIWAVAGISALSLLGSISLTSNNQPLAFFGLGTRAWELGLGALVALTPNLKQLPESALAKWLPVLGLGLIIGASFTFDDSTAFPGFGAVVPAAGATMLLIHVDGPVARFLSLRPLRAVGRWSYSLYLWHWPIYAFALLLIGNHDFTTRHRVLLLALAVLLSAATFRFWENPLRLSRRVLATGGRTLSFVAATTAVAIGLSFVLIWKSTSETQNASSEKVVSQVESTKVLLAEAMRGHPVPSNLTPQVAQARDISSMRSIRTHCMASQSDTGFPPCMFAATSSTRSIWVAGDSHANQWFSAFESAASGQKMKLVFHARSGCPVLLNIAYHGSQTLGDFGRCQAWIKQLNLEVAKAHPDIVVLANTVAIAGFQLDGYLAEMNFLRANVGQLIVLGDTPIPDRDIPVCVSLNPGDTSKCNFSRSGISGKTDWAQLNQSVRFTAEDAGVSYIDPQPWMCLKDVCPAVLGRVLMYRDQSHITNAAATLLAPQLALALAPFLKAVASHSSTVSRQ